MRGSDGVTEKEAAGEEQTVIEKEGTRNGWKEESENGGGMSRGTEKERSRGRDRVGMRTTLLGGKQGAERRCSERPEGLVFIASPVVVVFVGVVAVVVVVDSL